MKIVNTKLQTPGKASYDTLKDFGKRHLIMDT